MVIALSFSPNASPPRQKAKTHMTNQAKKFVEYFRKIGCQTFVQTKTSQTRLVFDRHSVRSIKLETTYSCIFFGISS